MAPNGPRAQTTVKDADKLPPQPPIPEGVVALDHTEPPKGPHPGHVQVACLFTLEQKLQRMLKEHGCEPGQRRHVPAARRAATGQRPRVPSPVGSHEESPVRTFDTACFYFHLFRLCHRDAEYNYQDAALASLFLACKVEDTIKKSKEILCAAYNIKNAEFTTTQDDKMFEQPSKIVIGLERLILETIGFDFRSRYAQKYFVKAIKTILGPSATKAFFATTYDMGIDLHKTFAPIKQTTWTMALAVTELTALVTGAHIDAVQKVKPSDWHTTRADIVETMLDLLDLYTQHPKSTKVGSLYEEQHFFDIKRKVMAEVDTGIKENGADRGSKISRYLVWCEQCKVDEPQPGFTPAITPSFTPSFTPGSPATTGSAPGSNPAVKRSTRGTEGTMRFVFDMDQAKVEKKAVDSYLHEEYDDVEIDRVEAIPEAERQQQQQQHHQQQHRDRRHEGGRGGPYSRNNNRDRRKGGPRFY
ncbi:C-type cyclin [Verticillium alfalfae VaMs.102]|uniref:C-type cyclin n=1 Tax=Verticillium alfalfae (strain VaMs.102 / ATCC MYA-4576 / FGSC 10136) TaxID=526221 RepID=C9S9A4_VERA1|nr:C-type cyclin [Verticillium alfalfae VaMs.102]EEY15007.1 C-type cyclin [Verticillium alfalfae VaMs.102]